jgi:hypothetical protein
MSKPADKASYGARPPGLNRTYNTRASSAKAAAPPNSQKQPSRQNSPAASPPPPTPAQHTSENQEDTQSEATYVARNEVLKVIANCLDEIVEKSNTLANCKASITKLAKFTWSAVEDDQDGFNAELITWCSTIVSRIDKLKSKQNKILEVTERLSEQTEGLQAVTKELENQVSKVSDVSNKLASSPTPYRDAVLGGNTEGTKESTHVRVLIDVEKKAKQIMVIVKDHDVALMDPEELTVRANNIIANLEDNNRPDPVKIDFTRKVANGGTILYTNSTEAANWLREPEIEEAFLSKFAKDSYVKERTYKVLLRGVPIIFDPSNEDHLREVEEVNELTKYSLLKAKWIKPEARRRKGQTHAHISALIAKAETANSIIQKGIDICGARIWPEKLKREPLQCMRCRRWGHFAVNCFEPGDTCGTCGEAHRTSQCKSTDKKHCVSCNTDTHTSWDRNCPEFVHRCKVFDENHPENKMVYFPTQEEWTLTTRPDRIPLETRFPKRFTVNDIPITTKKPNAKGKRPTQQAQASVRSTQTKGKGKEKLHAREEGELPEVDDYEECYDHIDYNDVERLIGSSAN